MERLSRQRQAVGLLGWLITCYAVSAVGAIASINAQSFYGDLLQPVWAPPSWVFGPVWTLLYGMMAISAWLVWRKGGFSSHRMVLSLFIVQLAVNGLWSWLFFEWNRGALALLDIGVLWTLILVVTVLFWRVKVTAALLLVPYLLWVTFAAALNYAVWKLNPSVLG